MERDLFLQVKLLFLKIHQNTVSKTTLGLDTANKNIEGKAVSNNPTNRDYFDINVKTGSWKTEIIYLLYLLVLLYLFQVQIPFKLQ